MRQWKRLSLRTAAPFVVLVGLASCSSDFDAPTSGDAAPEAALDRSSDGAFDASRDGFVEAGLDASFADGAASESAPEAGAADVAGEDAEGGSSPCVTDAAGGARTVYLNFQGATLSPGQENATANTTSLVAQVSSIAAFLANAGDRDTSIATIVGMVMQALAQYDVDIVQARPASGDYVMIVFGGTATDVGLPAGASPSLASIDCGDVVKDDIALVFETTNATGAANAAISVLGSLIGVDATTLAGDCMDVGYAATSCTLSSAAPKASSAQCAGPDPQDEPALFAAALDCKR